MKKAIVALLFLLSPVVVSGASFKAVVASVIDGSTITISTEKGIQTIHIFGYKSPAIGQPFHKEAKANLESIIGDSPVYITTLRNIPNTAKVEPSSYNDIPITMVVGGFGAATKDSNKTIKDLSKQAKRNKIGMWKNYNIFKDFGPRTRKQSVQGAIRIGKQKPKLSLYGDSAVNIPRDPDGTAVGEGGHWLIVEKTSNTTNIKPMEYAGAEAPVTNSFWDGSVCQVERWLDKHLKDPESFDAIEWSQVFKTNRSVTPYGVSCKYRARNSFGGMNIYYQVFYMDAGGKVLFYRDI